MAGGWSAPALAQSGGAPAVQAPPGLRPVPDQLELSKLIWSTILAVDHANRSGNYSVLRDMSAQGFQINNDAARLAQIFAGLRDSRIDLSSVLLVPPTYLQPPRQVQADVIQVAGVFQIRPVSVQFDLYYQWEAGRWKLFGVNLLPVMMDPANPGAYVSLQQQQQQVAPRPAQQSSTPRRR